MHIMCKRLIRYAHDTLHVLLKFPKDVASLLNLIKYRTCTCTRSLCVVVIIYCIKSYCRCKTKLTRKDKDPLFEYTVNL